MSYKIPPRTRRYIPYYPAQLKMADGNVISTGPYDKSRCGSAQKEVTEFLVHLVEIYEKAVQDRKDKVAKLLEEFESTQKTLEDEVL